MNLFALFLLLNTFFHLAGAQALTSWYTSEGPQVVYQNASTGDLMYMLDTGSGTSTGRFTAWAQLPVTVSPMIGTSLAGTAYPDGSGNVIGKIFYISDEGVVIQLIIKCVFSSGACSSTYPQGTYAASGNIKTGIDNSTRLAATLRSANDGYRVFYHDIIRNTRMIRYSGPLNMTWGAGTLVFNNTSEPLAGITADGGSILNTYGIDTSGNIVSSTLQNNGTWLKGPPISTQNFTAWYPSNVTLAATVEASALSNLLKRIFYIGADRSLHEIDSEDNGQTWIPAPNQSANIWPLADEPNATFTLCNNYAGTAQSLFYFSAGKLVQVQLASGVWQGAVSILQNETPTTASTFPSATSKFISGISTTATITASNSTTQNGKDGSRSQIGVGLGVGAGIPILAAFAAIGYLLFRGRMPKEDAIEPDMDDWLEYPPEVPAKDPIEVCGAEDVMHEVVGDLEDM